MKNKKYLDIEEKELIESFGKVDKAGLKKPGDREQKAIKKMASDYLKTQAKMNIRIDRDELNKIKKYAELEGLKYQTFVKSILHKYMTGRLVAKKD